MTSTSAEWWVEKYRLCSVTKCLILLWVHIMAPPSSQRACSWESKVTVTTLSVVTNHHLTVLQQWFGEQIKYNIHKVSKTLKRGFFSQNHSCNRTETWWLLWWMKVWLELFLNSVIRKTYPELWAFCKKIIILSNLLLTLLAVPTMWILIPFSNCIPRY